MGGGATPVVGQQTMAASSPVVIASDQSAIAVTLAGGATAAKQDTGNTSLGTIATAVSGTLTVAGAVTSVDLGAKADSAASTDTGTFSLIALVKRLLGKTPALGQALMAASRPVTIASDQTAIPVSGTINATMVDTAATGGAVPASAKYIGFNVGGLLTGISATNPLPTTASITLPTGTVVGLDTNTISLLGTSYTSPQFTALMSDPSGDYGEGTNLLELLMDSSQSVGIGTRLLNPPLVDAKGAAIISDAPAPIPFLSQNAASPLVVDTTGYSTMVFQQNTAGIVTITGSNDGVTYSAVVGFPIAAVSTAPTAGVTAAAGVYVVPVSTRYMKLTGPASTVTGTVYLRSSPASMLVAGLLQNINSVQFGGAAVVNAGVAGIPAVGGNIASGVLPTANPVLTAGIDTTVSTTGVTTRLTRTIAVDTTGRVQSAAIGATSLGTQTQLGVLNSPELNIPLLGVSDQQRFDGQTIVELLGRLLFEQQMTNQYLFNLARLIKRGEEESVAPEDMRLEPNLFTN